MRKYFLVFIFILFANLSYAGTTTNYGWDYGTQGQDPWWDIWVGIFTDIDTDLFTMIPKSTITAAGDVVVGTASATPGVIAKGANSSFFGVNSSGTLGFYTDLSIAGTSGTDYNFYDPTDSTKQAQFVFSSISASTIRAYTWPDVTGTVALTTSNVATATSLSDGDKGDISASSGTLTIDAGVVTAAKSASVMKTDGFCITLGNGADAITAGAYYSKAVRVPFKATLTKVILTTQKNANALTIDVWIDAPSATTGLQAITDADSLFDTATEPAIADASADSYVEVTSFDAGEDAIAAGDWIVVNADGSPTLTEANICFELTRTD